jgi:O-antigen ligase
MIAAVLNPVSLLLATLCLQWVALSADGALSLKLPYLALALVTLYVFTGPRKLSAVVLFVRQNLFWMAPFAIYLIILAAVLRGTPGENIAPRQLFYMVGTVALGGCIAATARLSTVLRTGSMVGLLLLVVGVELVARSIGLSWFGAIAAFLRGDLNYVVYTFLRDVFNAVNPDPGDLIGAATKNEVAVSVLVLVLLIRASSRNPAHDYLGMAILAGGFVLLVLLNTRSVLIVAALAVCIAAAIGAAARPERTVPSLLVKVGGAVVLAMMAITYSVSDLAASNTLSDRFAFDDYSSMSRVVQYQAALETIQDHALTGAGYFEIDGHVIHNLFLSSWVHTGLAGFALVLIFYVAIILAWVAFIARAVLRPNRWVLSIAPEWLAPLPIMPLFRVWLSGDAGHMFFGEWVSLAIFFGCILANRMQMEKRLALLRSLRRARAVPPPPTSQENERVACIAN